MLRCRVTGVRAMLLLLPSCRCRVRCCDSWLGMVWEPSPKATGMGGSVTQGAGVGTSADALEG